VAAGANRKLEGTARVHETSRLTMFLVVAVAALVACGRGQPTVIHVRNDSGVQLRDLVLSGTGFKVSLASLAPDGQVDLSAFPTGESGLGVSLVANGRTVTVAEQGYFEGGGRYEVDLVIRPDLSVAVDSRL